MSGAFSKLREILLYSTIVHDDKGNVEKQVMEDNRKAATIWSVVEIVFWTVCLAMSMNDPVFEVGRRVYAVVLAAAVITLVWSLLIARKTPRAKNILVYVMKLALLAAGIGIAFCQADVRSATFIAAVLIAPVMFVTNTLPTVLCEAACIVAFAVFSPDFISPDVQS